MSLFSKSKRFTDPLDTAVFTTVHVMNQQSPILAVYHDLKATGNLLEKIPVRIMKKLPG